MTNYKVKLVSQANAVIVIVLALISIFSFTLLFFPHGMPQSSAIVFVVITGFIFWCLWQYFATGRTEWEINDETINIHWTKPFMLTGKKDDGMDPQYQILRVLLFGGRKFKFIHHPLTTRDDFDVMIDALNGRMAIL